MRYKEMVDYISCIENPNKAKHNEQRIVKVPLDACIAHSNGEFHLKEARAANDNMCKGCKRWHEQAKALGRWPIKRERRKLTLEPVVVVEEQVQKVERRRLSL